MSEEYIELDPLFQDIIRKTLNSKHFLFAFLLLSYIWQLAFLHRKFCKDHSWTPWECGWLVDYLFSSRQRIYLLPSRHHWVRPREYSQGRAKGLLALWKETTENSCSGCLWTGITYLVGTGISCLRTCDFKVLTLGRPSLYDVTMFLRSFPTNYDIISTYE